MSDSERPMRVATVRAAGVFLVMFAFSIVATKAYAVARHSVLASEEAVFDFVVAREAGEALPLIFAQRDPDEAGVMRDERLAGFRAEP